MQSDKWITQSLQIYILFLCHFCTERYLYIAYIIGIIMWLRVLLCIEAPDRVIQSTWHCNEDVNSIKAMTNINDTQTVTLSEASDGPVSRPPLFVWATRPAQIQSRLCYGSEQIEPSASFVVLGYTFMGIHEYHWLHYICSTWRNIVYRKYCVHTTSVEELWCHFYYYHY